MTWTAEHNGVGYDILQDGHFVEFDLDTQEEVFDYLRPKGVVSVIFIEQDGSVSTVKMPARGRFIDPSVDGDGIEI